MDGTTDDDVNSRRSLSSCSLTDSLETDELNGDHVGSLEHVLHQSRLPVRCRNAFDDEDGGDINAFICMNNSEHKTKETKVYRACLAGECSAIGQAKETLTSRRRVEKAHHHHKEPEDYLTPTQRKGMTIRDLKKQVKDLEKIVSDKDSLIVGLRSLIGEEAQSALDLKNKEVKEFKDKWEAIATKNEEITFAYDESLKTACDLESTLRELRESIVQKEQQHEVMYLEMYEKGKQSEQFEREEELEMLVKSGKGKVSLKELQKKLVRSQSELAKWQSMRREEMYEVAERPITEPETKLRFLKDSFFHFLTSDRDSDDCLRAMIQIFNFTDVQKKKITKILLDKNKFKPKT